MELVNVKAFCNYTDAILTKDEHSKITQGGVRSK